MLLDVPDRYQLGGLLQAALAPPLPPLVFDAKTATLQLVLYGPENPVEVLVHQIEPGLPLLVYGLPSGASSEILLEQLCAVLGLDEDLNLFYALSEKDSAMAFARERDAARCLRSPTVFEDLVKCMLRARACTSQPLCPPTSELQELICRLCELLGTRTNLGRSAFPTAAALAAAPSALYERELPAALSSGRRSGGTQSSLWAPLRALAERCCSGELYPESLRRQPRRWHEVLGNEQLFTEVVQEEIEWQFRIEHLLRRLPGFGPRARDLVLPLLYCYDLPALDIVSVRAWHKRYSAVRRRGLALRQGDPEWQRVVRAIERRAAPYVLYGGLVQRLLLQSA
jgi:hypothetical protein